jgi:hypothetical protein
MRRWMKAAMWFAAPGHTRRKSALSVPASGSVSNQPAGRVCMQAAAQNGWVKLTGILYPLLGLLEMFTGWFAGAFA